MGSLLVILFSTVRSLVLFWIVLGYAFACGGFVCLLVDGGLLSECYRVEDGSSLSYVKACGWNEKIEVSKTKRGLWRSLNPFSFFHSLLR